LFPQLILRLIQSCEDAAGAGVCRDEIRNRLIPERVRRVFKTVVPKDFLEWVQEDPDYGYYYRELEQLGVGGNPAEAAAMILEAIVLDALG